jgi:two-component system, sensor histidine kinase
MHYPLPAKENDRLRALQDLGIIDTPADTGLDTLVALATLLFNTPIALVTLVDETRQWFKAKIGLKICETERQHAFCSHAIMTDEVFIVEDATKDPRFCNNPYVVGAPQMRAYAGAPIIISNGLRVGTVCVIDTRPRQFTSDQIKSLAQLANLVAGRLKLLTVAAHAEERFKQLQEANRLAARAQVILDIMSDGVVVQDRTGAIVSANDSACKVLGLTLDQLMGRTSVDVRWRSVNEDGSEIAGEEHPAMVTLATGQPVNHLTLGIEQPNRSRRWLRVSSRPLFEDELESPSHAVVTFSDITEVLEKEQALRGASQRADAASHAKSVFLANVSHEIRTPLNGVIGLTSVLSQTELTPSQREMVVLIKTSGDTLERLLSDILDVSKIEAGKLEMLIAPMDLHEAVQAAAQLIGLRADEKGITFDVKFGPNTKGQFLGDSIRIRQIISNLSSNALKFTKKGGIVVTVDIEDRPDSTPETWLKLSVIDTGMGFDDETAKRLFSRFEQADSSITRAYGGTGLGLSICRSLTDLMGGTIEGTSTLGMGSMFNVCIPLQRVALSIDEGVESAPAIAEAIVDLDDEYDDSPLRVLMAEDHPINQRVTSLCLAPWGAQITIAENGVEAVEAFKVGHFDIVLMDMQMPEMDGLEATRLIRALEQERGQVRTPIAMLSANAMPEHVRAALAAGCDHHIAKPVTPAALGLGMEEAMRQATLAQNQAIGRVAAVS